MGKTNAIEIEELRKVYKGRGGAPDAEALYAAQPSKNALVQLVTEYLASRRQNRDVDSSVLFGADKFLTLKGQDGPGKGKNMLHIQDANGLFVVKELIKTAREGGGFTDEALFSGTALNRMGRPEASMGIAVGDVDGDGDEDLILSHLDRETNTLYLNEGDGFFEDATSARGLAAPSWQYTSFGIGWVDYDNDGWLDLMVVNGHVYPQMAEAKLGASAGYRQRKLFFRNKRDGTFEEIGESFGPAFTELRVSRGLALGDLDNDGRLDVVIGDIHGKPQILHNRVESPGNWLLVDLEGKGKLTDAIGAVITAKVGDRVMSRMVRSGTSYLSQEDMRQHFGLADAAKVDLVEVRWPDGSTSGVEDVAGSRRVEGRDLKAGALEHAIAVAGLRDRPARPPVG